MHHTVINIVITRNLSTIGAVVFNDFWEIVIDGMEKLQDMVILEKVTKVNYQMEAIRRFSYPYQALEEAVVNAFYHRDYLSYQSIIIEIEPELVRIISFPGIDRSIPMRVIDAGERFTTRYYRNKRLGEFLKELDLSEGKSTGVPTIQEELRKNGSSKARFTTDEDRRAVTVEIPIHPDFLENEGKSVVSGAKPLFGEEKSVVSGVKPLFEGTETVVSKEKTIFESIVASMPCKNRVKTNIRKLYETVGEDIFGRADIMSILKLSETTSGDLIKRLEENDLIEPVSGYGKGKYRFR